MNNINKFFSSLRYPIRISIIQVMNEKLHLRESIPKDSDNYDGFCPEDILNLLNELGYELTYSKLSYHLKEMRENNILKYQVEGKRRFYRINTNAIEELILWLNKFI